MTGLRILVTGSRDWQDRDTVAYGLKTAITVHAPDDLFMPHPELGVRLAWDRITVVHGAARGADSIAAGIAHAWGMNVEPHPVTSADWERYGRAAGHRRNAHMVDLGADVCLAFPIGLSAGTRGCTRLAEKANIPVIVYEGEPADRPIPRPMKGL